MTLFNKVATGILLAGSVAAAHPGPRIFLGSDAGQVTTYLGNNNDASTTFTPDRVFTANLPNFLNSGIYTTDFPGFQVAEGKGIRADTTFAFKIAGPLLYFDDYNAINSTGTYRSVADAFIGELNIPQLAVSQDSSVQVTASGPVAGFDFFTYAEPGDHGHTSFTLFGNGVSASDGPNGVYALPLTLTGGGLGESESFYLLLGKDVAMGTPEFAAAESVARGALVPEPTAFVAVALGSIALLRRRARIHTIRDTQIA